MISARLLLDSTAAGIYGINHHGICTFCNAACVRILGYDNADQIIGHKMHDLIHHSHADGTPMPAEECVLLKNMDQQLHSDGDMFWRADGSSFPVEYWSYPILQDDKNLGQVVSFVDITERKQAEKAFIEVQELRDRAEAIAHVGSWRFDLATNQLTWSDEVYRIFGCEPQSFPATYETFLNFIHPADRIAVSTAYADSLREGGDLYELEHRIIRQDNGEVRYVYEQGVHKRDAAGAVIQSFGMVQEITERKKNQDQQLLAQFSIEHTHDSVFWIDERGDFKFVNAAACQQLGYSRDELLQLSVADVDPNWPTEKWPEHFEQLRQQKQILLETLHRTRDGNILHVEVSANYFKQQDREFNFAFVRNINARKQAEDKVQKSKNMLRQVIDLVPHLIFAKDIHGTYLLANKAMADAYGTTPNNLLGKSDVDFSQHTEEVEFYIECDKKVIESGTGLYDIEESITDAKGTRRLVETTKIPFTASGIKTPAVLAVSVDITERKRVQLALQQKNEEMEQLVYSVSHDLKSPLVTVKAFVSILRQDLLKGDQPQINADLNYIDKAADKMGKLLDTLLQYSRIGRIDSPAQTLSADQQVQNCLTTLAGILRQHQVQVSTGDLPHQLHGDSLHFGQIWQNLIENAVKYRGDQPHIEIGSTQEGQEVVFYVRDNGMGIAPEHNERIFNLFSQLNPDSDGSGLGLALVKKIVSIYQGRIWVESAGDGKGSCFMFTLPGALIKGDKAI